MLGGNMSQQTKSVGVRLPVELCNWIDQTANRHGVSRNKYIHQLILKGRKPVLASSRKKPVNVTTKDSWTVNVAWYGFFFTTVLITLTCISAYFYH